MKRPTILTVAVSLAVFAGGIRAEDNTTDGLLIPNTVQTGWIEPCSAEAVRLGTYALARWTGGGALGIPERTVGDPARAATTDAELVAHKNESVAACATAGQAMITETEAKLNEQRNSFSNLLQWLCPTCNISPGVGDQTDAQIAAMTLWYQIQINDCRRFFTNRFDTLRTQLCQ
ncbi:MAG: hypothetical protein OXE76_02265 [Alphaproteobacteria bacterium]|nr:hypothetical protein [Alphaproteobacteria bacterium]